MIDYFSLYMLIAFIVILFVGSFLLVVGSMFIAIVIDTITDAIKILKTLF